MARPVRRGMSVASVVVLVVFTVAAILSFTRVYDAYRNLHPSHFTVNDLVGTGTMGKSYLEVEGKADLSAVVKEQQNSTLGFLRFTRYYYLVHDEAGQQVMVVRSSAKPPERLESKSTVITGFVKPIPADVREFFHGTWKVDLPGNVVMVDESSTPPSLSGALVLSLGLAAVPAYQLTPVARRRRSLKTLPLPQAEVAPELAAQKAA